MQAAPIEACESRPKHYSLQQLSFARPREHTIRPHIIPTDAGLLSDLHQSRSESEQPQC